VTKNEQQSNSTSGPRPSALKVSVPSDLEGGSFFLVKTQKGILILISVFKLQFLKIQTSI
jgi:hypothetical protein